MRRLIAPSRTTPNPAARKRRAPATKPRNAKPRNAKPRNTKPFWRSAAPFQRWRIAGAALGVALLLGGIGWLVNADWPGRAWDAGRDAAIVASGKAGFKVTDVLVTGREHTAKAALLKALGTQRGAPIFALDSAAARQRVEALPWVRRAIVQRRLPGTVVVTLAERHPMALWQRGGRLSLVDSEGTVIKGADLTAFRDLLVVVGDKAPGQVPALLALLHGAPSVAKRVTGAVWVGARRWNLRIDDRLDVRLPEHAPHLALARLAVLQTQHHVLERDLALIDLRLPDRLILRPGGVPIPSNVPAKRGQPAGAAGGKTT